MHRLSHIRLPQLDLRRRAPALGLMALYAYLAFHAFSGSQGLLSWISYSDEAKVLQVKLDARQARHADLKARVDALSNDGLDLDALEIAARRDLFVSDTNEITIWLDP
ncbi:FtsB family cell division protein [Litorimonas cladophorae]|nr:septum formation initiator family protein [Litorimonas cladophorae]